MGNAEVMKSYSAFDVYILRRNWSIQSNLFATPYLYSSVVVRLYPYGASTSSASFDHISCSVRRTTEVQHEVSVALDIRNKPTRHRFIGPFGNSRLQWSFPINAGIFARTQTSSITKCTMSTSSISNVDLIRIAAVATSLPLVCSCVTST